MEGNLSFDYRHGKFNFLNGGSYEGWWKKVQKIEEGYLGFRNLSHFFFFRGFLKGKGCPSTKITPTWVILSMEFSLGMVCYYSQPLFLFFKFMVFFLHQKGYVITSLEILMKVNGVKIWQTGVEY